MISKLYLTFFVFFLFYSFCLSAQGNYVTVADKNRFNSKNYSLLFYNSSFNTTKNKSQSFLKNSKPDFQQLASSANKEDIFSLNYGLRLGYVCQSKIGGLGTTVLNEPFFSKYTMDELTKKGWAGSAYVSYRFMETIAVQGEVGYAQQGAALKYKTLPQSNKDFFYDMNFNYQYFNISGMAKIYPTGWKRIWH